MNNKKTKIPLIIISKDMTSDSKNILKDIIELINDKKITYVILNNSEYYLYVHNHEFVKVAYEQALKITSCCIIIESNYESGVIKIVDNFLDLGKDILCFPNSIFNKNALFSNNLIRDGAFCISSKYMLIEYLTS